MTNKFRSKPTWFAAKPIPSASYIVSNKSSIKDYNYAKLLLNKKVALVGPSSNTLNTKQYSNTYLKIQEQ